MAETKTIKRYRLAGPGDEGRECWVSNGTKEVAFAYANNPGSKETHKIDGFYKGNPLFLSPTGIMQMWKHVVVADEAPDPGPGYRLLKKQEYDGEEEFWKTGDEVFWEVGDDVFKVGSWIDLLSSHISGTNKQQSTLHYRRRITPVEADNDNTKQVEVAKVEAEANEQPATPPAQPTDSPFVKDAAVQIFAGLVANPSIIQSLGEPVSWQMKGATPYTLGDYAWYCARELERAQHTSREVTE